MWIVSNWNAPSRHITGVVWEAVVRSPYHGLAVPKEAMLGIFQWLIIAPSLVDRAFAISVNITLMPISRRFFNRQSKLIRLAIDACFVWSQVVANELRRRNVIELVLIDFNKPVPVPGAVPKVIKHDGADPLPKYNSFVPKRNNAVVPICELQDRFPGAISATGIIDVDEIRPRTGISERLVDNINRISRH